MLTSSSKSGAMTHAIPVIIDVLTRDNRPSEVLTLSDADRALYSFDKSVKRAVVVKPDSTELLARVNAELRERASAIGRLIILRPERGFDGGTAGRTVAYIGDTFRALGFAELANGLNVNNMKDRIATFTRATIVLRRELYALANNNGYRMKYAHKSAVDLLTVVVRKSVTERNCYLFGVESVEAAVKSVSDKITAEREAETKRQAERDAKRSEAKAKLAAVVATPHATGAALNVKRNKSDKRK